MIEKLAFFNSCKGFIVGNSQKHKVIRLTEKKEKDKWFIQNWRPLSLLNTDEKILSKVIAQRLRLSV